MAGSLNSVQLIGNLGADPEIRSAGDNRVANLRIATSESWKDKNSGERKEKTEWHSVTIWGDGLVGVVEKYVKKGSKIYVQGQLQTRKWQDKDGNDRYTTEVVLTGMNGKLLLLGDGGGSSRDDRQDQSGPTGDGGGSSGGFSRDVDDEVPF